MSTQKELLIDELFSIYERAANVDDIKIFSPILYEFLEKLFDPLLKKAIEELWEACTNDRAPLDSQIKNITQKMWPICKEVTTYIEQNDIKNQAITNEIPWLQNCTELNAAATYLQFFALQKILMALLGNTTTSHRDFIKNYAHIDETNQTQPIKLFFDLDALEPEMHYLDRIKKTRDWYSLQKITSFCIIYDPKIYEEHKNSMLNNGQPINHMVLTVRYKALCRAIDPGVDPQFREEGFQPNDYKGHMQKLCYYAKKKLLSTDVVPQKKKPKQKKYITQWDSVNLCIVIDGKPLPGLIEGKGPALLLDLAFQGIKILKNGLTFKTVFNKIKNDSESKLDPSQEKKMYDLCKGVNDYLKLQGYPKIFKIKDKTIFFELCYEIIP